MHLELPCRYTTLTCFTHAWIRFFFFCKKNERNSLMRLETILACHYFMDMVRALLIHVCYLGYDML